MNAALAAVETPQWSALTSSRFGYRHINDLESSRPTSSQPVGSELVDLIGIKPTTSSLRTKRSIN